MSKPAKQVATACEDAYSFDRYASWTAVAAALLRRGYTAEQTEDVMRSKVTRWAADASGKPYGRATANDVLRYLERQDVGALLDWSARGLR